MRQERIMHLIPAAMMALVMAVGHIGTAAPASAAVTVTFDPRDGFVGEPIPLTATVAEAGDVSGPGTVAYFASDTKVAQAPVDATGHVAAASWTPNRAGTLSMHATYTPADGSAPTTSPSASVMIDKARTRTTLSAPLVARTGSAMTVTATVKDGSYRPTGTVVFERPDGSSLGTRTLDSDGSVSISLRAPSSPAVIVLRARYRGDDNASPSSSDPASIAVTRTGSVITVSLSSGPYVVGIPETLTATLTPASLVGTVDFTAGGAPVGTVTATNGKASVTWTPSVRGTIQLAATFTRSGATKPLGTATKSILVAGSLPPNTITIGPVGQPAWAQQEGVAIRYQQSITLDAHARSGDAVRLTVAGPCGLAGNVLTANAGVGACTLTATSPQTSLFASATRTVPIALARGRQTAVLAAPNPGLLARHTRYRLARPDTRTNAGTAVLWAVVAGRSHCRVIVQANGAVRLQTLSRGRCIVRASASPIPQQWLRYRAYFHYRVR